MLRTLFRFSLVLWFTGASAQGDARAQAPQGPDHQHAGSTSPTGWNWTHDGSAFFGYNYQFRGTDPRGQRLTDFTAWESQNWFMLTGERAAARGRVMLHAMTSLEPFTIRALGSPQVFQTGESYHGAPLIDRQHPHELVMQLGTSYDVRRDDVTYLAGADLVGSATLGPTPFMHRVSARNNPQAPLSHHYLDSTHITPGVLRGGIEVASGFTFEGSWFRGEEPNDNRLNIDRPRLDSWAIRGRWHRGPWQAQVSGGHLKQPEWFERFDLPRLTASIEFNGTIVSRPTAATLAWGENREVHGTLDAYLFEWDVRATTNGSIYGRSEATAKDLLDLGSPDPPGFISFHRISHVAALTAGYIYDLPPRAPGRIGIGADLTVYRVPDNMIEYYGSPHSLHVFMRWRPNGAQGHEH